VIVEKGRTAALPYRSSAIAETSLSRLPRG
jgi:hypothetical protein